MTKLTLTFALLLTAATAAHAQDRTPAGTPLPNGTSNLELRIIKDSVIRDEYHINATRNINSSMEREADAAQRTRPRTFKAEIKVTNSAAKAIQSINWTATLTDSETGAVLRSYDVTTDARIAPGRTKKLSKRLQTPAARILRVNSQAPRRPATADLKVEVTGVTYVDGSTSTTP